MSARRAVWEVARRELVERSRSRVHAGLARAAADPQRRRRDRRCAPERPDAHRRRRSRRPALRGARARDPAAGQGRRPRVRLHPLASAPAASRAVRDGAVDVALIDGRRMLVKSSRSQAAVRVVQDAVAAQGVLDRLRSSGLTQAQALGALAPRALPVEVLEPRRAQHRAQPGADLQLGCSCSSWRWCSSARRSPRASPRRSPRASSSCCSRRSRRGACSPARSSASACSASRSWCSPAPPRSLAGRLAGGAGLPSAAPETVALVLLWFVLGYVFYSVAFAAVGRARLPPGGPATPRCLPITVVLIGAFYLALIAVNSNPNGTVARIAAFVPPLSPMVVPARMVLGDMTAVGLALSGRARPPRHRRDGPARRAHLRASDPPDRRTRQATPPFRPSLAPAAPRKRHGQRNTTRQHRGYRS